MRLLSRVLLFATPWTVAYQAPPSMEFSRQEYWSGLPFPSAGDLPNAGIEPRSPTLQADALPSQPPGSQTSAMGGKGGEFAFRVGLPPTLHVSGQARPQTWLGGGLRSRFPTSVNSTNNSELLAPTRHCPSPRVSMKMSEKISMEVLCHPKWVSA